MMKKLRVLLFTGLPIGYTKSGEKLTHGGWMSELIKRLKTDTTLELGIAFQHTDTVFKKDIEQVTYYPLTKKTGKLASVNRFFFYGKQEKEELEKMRHTIDDFRPDIVHVFGTEGVFGLIAPLINVPTVIHLQGIMIPYLNAWFPPSYSAHDLKGITKHWMFKVVKYWVEREKRIFEGCHYYMGRTDWDRNVSRLFSPKSSYFHCDEMLRNEFYTAPWTPKITCSERLQLTSVISTPLYKGQDVILKTAKLLKEQLGLDFEWQVYGNWDLKLHENKSRIKASEHNIRLMGRVSPADLVVRLQESDIFIHPSYIDNSPNSVCEAQYLGLPVIACNVGGVGTLIQHESDGILVPANDPYQIAYYISKLKGDQAFYKLLGEKGRSTAIKRHNPDKIITDFVNIYHKIIKHE